MSMDKQRPLTPDDFRDETLIALPIPVRMTAIGLRLHADDQGRETATPWMAKAAIWPGNSEITEDDVVEHLLLLDQVGYIGLYSDQNRTYYRVRDWPKPSHPQPSKYPDPPADLFQRGAGTSPDGRSAWEREGAGESEGEWAEGGPDGCPAPFCKVHMPGGTRVDCRHCGTARNAHNWWIKHNRDSGVDLDG